MVPSLFDAQQTIETHPPPVAAAAGVAGRRPCRPPRQQRGDEHDRSPAGQAAHPIPPSRWSRVRARRHQSSLPGIRTPCAGFGPDVDHRGRRTITVRASDLQTCHRGSVHSAPLLLTCDTFQAPPLIVSVTANCDFVPFEPGRLAGLVVEPGQRLVQAGRRRRRRRADRADRDRAVDRPALADPLRLDVGEQRDQLAGLRVDATAARSPGRPGPASRPAAPPSTSTTGSPPARRPCRRPRPARASGSASAGCPRSAPATARPRSAPRWSARPRWW